MDTKRKSRKTVTIAPKDKNIAIDITAKSAGKSVSKSTNKKDKDNVDDEVQSEDETEIEDTEDDEAGDVIEAEEDAIDDENILLTDEEVATNTEAPADNENIHADTETADVGTVGATDAIDVKEPESAIKSTENGCIYKDVAEETSQIITEDDVSTDVTGETWQVPDEERRTKNRLTRYEFTRIIGTRSKQITLGAKVMVKNAENMKPDSIAIEELKADMIYYKLKRPMPDNSYEMWKLSELEKNII
ncbi:MAG: putative DNA-dependent RNA polymerase subunit Rpb6 [Faunusvirus sp.]|jgi:DNA-directed RNA polymerase subunit K/omega|uniref:Putative DNA-dependent RNA polymerase subunit Rpb6 n=1 Tax=Faunusvirus sp. TaxID=2487766 RepID=A0A3G5A1P8_9VIRU|nr:MAG: putative DNA-dependent RNA polymerase subunit Rpb6 [Faunusvirus sp.]